MDADIFDETLFDGTEDEIESLKESIDVRSSYDYAGDRFTVRYGSEIISHFKPIHEPNCVSVLGKSYKFA